MMRATFLSTIDQVLLSILNFALAFALIRYSSKEEYGLYAQLLSLQSLFSPLHAGLFVSAYLALASRMEQRRGLVYRAGMARAELLVTAVSTLVVATITYVGAGLIGAPLGLRTALASSIAILSLWWREFSRQICFADLQYRQALRIDLIYAAVVAIGFAVMVCIGSVSASSTLWCMALGGALAAVGPLVAAVRAAKVRVTSIVTDVQLSWRVGRWDTIGSVVSWGNSQSYIYFASLHGGLGAAAEISAGRLLAAPLMLLWASYANVLRPTGTRALTSGNPNAVRRLAARSILFVSICSAAYASATIMLLPLAQRSIFHGEFQELPAIATCWIAYSTLAGLTTIAASLLRSALEFRQVFARQVVSCIAALLLLTLSLDFKALYVQVLALVVVEAISVILLWHRFAQSITAESLLRPSEVSG